MSNGPDRRAVMGALAASAALTGAAGAAVRTPYRVGVIGAGWFGKLNANALMQVAPVEITAFCDVDRAMLQEAQALTLARPDSVRRQTRRATLYNDYRRMLDAQRFDIVIVATPDHWHALPAIAALDKGAHVYLEKPITVDVVEGQALVAAARRNDRVVQVGAQRRTAPFLIEARDRVVRPGLLGKVKLVEVFCYYHQRIAHFSPATTPPATLDWDFYCGPAPLAAYYPELHPRNWRSFEVFGNGYMGDVGVHMIDACRWLLGLRWPKRISSEGGIYADTQSAATVPDTQIASFEFDDLLMTWTNRHWGRAPNPAQPWGAAIHGENGTLMVYTEGYEWLPREGNSRLEATLDHEQGRYAGDNAMPDWERGLQTMTRHNMRNFLNAIETHTRPSCDIEEGHISTACCILANMSLKLGRPLRWDAAAQRIIGDDEAQAMLARPYRAPWRHPQAS